MRGTPYAMAILLMLAALPPAPSAAAEDPAVARSKEMLRRTQEALRQAQSDNADLKRAKDEAEQKLAAATHEIDAAKNGTKAVQASYNSKLKSAEDTQADLTHRIGESNDKLSAANAKLAETTKELAARDSELAQVKKELDASHSATASCETKNVTLYGYAEAALKSYQNKGVWAAISQKEPVLGLKQVDVDNVVQEYQQKFDSQKIQPH